MDFEEASWVRLREYVQAHGLVRHQKESFDFFVSSLLPYIVSENSDVWSTRSDGQVSHCIRFSNVHVMKPSVEEFDGCERPLTPHAARMRSLNYQSNVFVEATHDVLDVTGETPKVTKRTTYKNVLLFRLPVMVRSCICHLACTHGQSHECCYDEGGYFIVNGVEKCLVAQEKLRHNMPYVFPGKGTRGTHLVGEVRSCHESKMRSTSTIYIYGTRPTGSSSMHVTAQLPFLDGPLPILYVFALLHVSYDEVFEFILGDAHGVPDEVVQMVHSITSARPALESYDDILDYVGREHTKETFKEKRDKYVEHVLASEVLPHQTLDKSRDARREKAMWLGMLLRKMCHVALGLQPADERDHYAHKRVDSAGMLLSLLFRQLFRAYLKSVTAALHKYVEADAKPRQGFCGPVQTDAVLQMITDKRITQGLRYAMSTGNWGIMKTTCGVAQMLPRLNTEAPVAALRRLNVPINREGKVTRPRQVHRSTYGVVCAAETPEGIGCGLVRALSLLVHIRLLSPASIVEPIVERECQLHARSPRVVASFARVFVNGKIVGYLPNDQTYEAHSRLRKLRAIGDLPYDTSLIVDSDLFICTDMGALCRPLLRAEGVEAFCNPECTWMDLMHAGYMEYVDKHEEEMYTVAHSWNGFDPSVHSHIDLHPVVQQGLCAALIPFANHDQAPRVTYQSAMCKQALGIPAINFMQRMDTISHVLLYPQRPIVSTRLDDMLGVSSLPATQNPIVCILCYGGENQEDSLYIKKTALDLGMFRSMHLRTYKDQEVSSGIDAERFGKPSPDCVGMRSGCYDKLDADGFVRVGETVALGDAILGKVCNTTDVEQTRKVVRRDRSTLVKCTEPSVVDAVFRTRTKEGHVFARVRTRSLRIPQVGDKASSRHGQKGVISRILPIEDMPCTADGITPDIIVNPHAIPSRMTIAQLLETLLGKVCALEGKVGDGTPFCNADVDTIAAALGEHGYESYGRETLVNGMTGEVLHGHVFLGPCAYQRLKHMVEDKVHARGQNGPVQLLTRQPLEGRARDGGLRVGEMEKDCIISHGATANLNELLFSKSDAFVCTVCKRCGILCAGASKTHIVRNTEARCPQCKSGDALARVSMPYATKLWIHELQSMNVTPRLRVTQSETTDVARPDFAIV